MGVVFRGCVDREGVILSIDETSDTVGRAGMPLRNLIAPAERAPADALVQDREWSGIRFRPVHLHTGAAAVLIAASVSRLVDVALIPSESALLGIEDVAGMLWSLLDNVDGGIWILDAKGGGIAANARMNELIERPRSLWDHLDAERAEQIRAEFGSTLWRRTARLRPEGPELELTGFPIRDGEGSPIGTLVRASAETTGVGEYVRLVRGVLHDPLTGLPGRTHLLDRLATAAQEPGAGVVALLRCAVDGFTIINDSHGHRTGDELLVQISDRLRTVLGPDDYLARLGGDEFVLLCRGLASAQDAHPVAERLLGAFAEPFTVGATALEVFASIGLVSYAPESQELTGPVLLERADAAMRQAKSDSLAGGWAEYSGS